MSNIKFGFSQRDITPHHSLQTIGFGRPDEWSRGVLDSLITQITVWRLDTEICALIAIDHIGFSITHANSLRDEVSKLLGTSREKVMLCFSHTHSAPNDDLAPEYFDFVCSEVKSGVSEALENMTPITCAWGNAYTDVGINRRSTDNLSDHRIGILKVNDASSSKTRLILLRLTVHNNVLKGDNYLISSDFFGTVRDTLQSEYHCPIIVTQGASGNIAPKFFKSELTPPDASDERFIRSDTALKDMAQAILHDISSVTRKLNPVASSSLSMSSKEISLYAPVPSYDEALKIAKEAKEYCGIVNPNWLLEVQHLLEHHIQKQEVKIEVQYFHIGHGTLCGVPNELMCEFALNASSILNDELFYLGGYTNGCTGYFPTEEEFDKGGYEVYWSLLHFYMYFGHVYPLERNSATQFIQFVTSQIQ